MSAQWRSNFGGGIAGRVAAALASLAHAVADPVLGGRLRRVVLALLLLWAVAALSHLVWAVFPPLRNPLPETATVVNPVAVATDASPSVQGPDMERMRAWHLFGEVGADDRGGAPSPDPSRVAALEGIEKGARQTRLALATGRAGADAAV